jgi:adenosylcobyric acid synthase
MAGKSIMLQGTGSSVGKSLLAAGLCRIFKNDGYNVAPFKSQNMALNSYITKDGMEMGRAQVMQAEASGKEPDVLMNPVLLKPTSDKKAQVIINGKVDSNMSAIEYHEVKKKLSGIVMEAYSRLSSENDIVVIEGAGSPAEINLMENDIVNMGMARMSDSPVILIGDIDKGGVFASLAGTMLLLPEEDKKRVKGVIINKFRGDIKILESGLRMLEDIIKIPVLGVVPYKKLNIEDEDGFASEHIDRNMNKKSMLEIAIIRLPHISNFTDFNALENIEGVSLTYIERATDIKNPDLIIIPGSKNTLADLNSMRVSGIEAAIIKKHKENDIPVIGICGGYQMLGTYLSDPDNVESGEGKIAGMGLLDIKTEFKKDKRTTQTSAVVSNDRGILEGAKGMSVKGYEIHMGISTLTDNVIPFLKTDTGEFDGVINKKGTVIGTYLHGIFDEPYMTGVLINNLRKRKGLDILENFTSYKEFKEKEYDKLDSLLRENLDMKKIYEITGVK